jgi:hypothetical protein
LISHYFKPFRNLPIFRDLFPFLGDIFFPVVFRDWSFYPNGDDYLRHLLLYFRDFR